MSRSRTRGRHWQLAVFACALVASGCTLPSSGIDPSGQRILAPSSSAPPGAPQTQGNCKQSRFPDYPGPAHSWSDTAVMLNPQSLVAPVGSEVILLGGVRGRDNCLRTNRRLEWSITEGSVGHFIEVGDGGCWDYVAGDFTKRRKVDNTYAIGSTSHAGVHLTRGTPAPNDDVYVLAGQGWISLTSPIEGTSNVTVYAPDVYAWNARLQSATVHWIDCQFRCPPPGIRRAGSRHALTTEVRRRDETPCVGWRVRYEIVSGPPAGFDPDGAAVVEVTTDTNGNANADIFQKQIGPGDNTIAISVIRPGELPGSGGRQLVLRASSTSVKWTADSPALPPTTPGTATPPITPPATPPAIPATSGVDLKVSGPTQVTVGQEVVFEMTITNRTAAPIAGLVIRNAYDVGLELYDPVNKAVVNVNPTAKTINEAVGAGQTYTAHAIFRIRKAGQLCQTVEIRAPNKRDVLARQRVCLTAAGAPADGARPEAGTGTPGATRASLSVTKTGPAEATVGQTVLFNVDIVNNGGQELTNIRVVDKYDPGLQLTRASRELQPEASGVGVSCTIDRLKPGEFRKFQVECLCESETKRTCNRVEVTAPGGIEGRSEACLEIKRAAGTIPRDLFPGAGTTPGATAPGATTDKLAINIRSVQPSYQVGKPIAYRIAVTNPTTTVERWLKVEATVPNELTPDRVGTTSPGASPPGFKGKTVTFEVPEIRPAETLVFNLRAVASQPGTVTVTAQATTYEQPRPVAAETTTEVKR